MLDDKKVPKRSQEKLIAENKPMAICSRHGASAEETNFIPEYVLALALSLKMANLDDDGKPEKKLEGNVDDREPAFEERQTGQGPPQTSVNPLNNNQDDGRCGEGARKKQKRKPKDKEGGNKPPDQSKSYEGPPSEDPLKRSDSVLRFKTGGSVRGNLTLRCPSPTVTGNPIEFDIGQNFHGNIFVDFTVGSDGDGISPPAKTSSETQQSKQRKLERKRRNTKKKAGNPNAQAEPELASLCSYLSDASVD